MGRTAVALLRLAALVLAGRRSGSDERLLFVLLTDNRLLRVSADGEVLTRTRLGGAPSNPSYGGLLAASPDRRTVFALVRGKRQQVAAIGSDGSVRERYGRGADGGLVFVALDAGKVDRSVPLAENPADVLALAGGR